MSENKAHFLALIGQPPGGRGRNTKFDPVLHCNIVREMGKRGEFQEAWASEIGVTIATMRDWVRKHEEFREAVIIAHQLLVTFWTRKVAENVAAEGAKPGMFQILIRRFPAIYGKSPIDLQAWLLEEATKDGATQAAFSSDQVKAASTEELTERLAVLRRRREVERQ